MASAKVFGAVLVIGLGGWLLTAGNRGRFTNIGTLGAIWIALYLVFGFINELGCGVNRGQRGRKSGRRRFIF